MQPCNTASSSTRSLMCPGRCEPWAKETGVEGARLFTISLSIQSIQTCKQLVSFLSCCKFSRATRQQQQAFACALQLRAQLSGCMTALCACLSQPADSIWSADAPRDRQMWHAPGVREVLVQGETQKFVSDFVVVCAKFHSLMCFIALTLTYLLPY